MKYFRPKAFFIIITIFFIHALATSCVAHAELTVPLGNIFADTTLDPSDTYIVDGQDTVINTATLTIPAGTHLLFTAGSELRINGTLAAKGTSSNHISVVGGVPPPFIPLALPIVIPRADTSSTEISSDDIDTEQSAETQSPEVAPLVINNSIMMSADDTSGPVKHFGFLFNGGSVNSLSYVDISDATIGMLPAAGSTVTADHVTFTDCDTGIEGGNAIIKLSNTKFVNVPLPATLDFHGTFTHTNTTFNNTGIPGWQMGGDTLPGDTMKLDSTDGPYYLRSVVISKDAAMTIGPGVSILVRDEGGVEVDGALTASGTADHPITVYGDSDCSTHSHTLFFNKTDAITLSHVNFQNLCGGISASQSTVTMNNDDFDTVAGPAVSAVNQSIANANDITMNDIYQAFDIDVGSRLILANAVITLVNGTDPAIELNKQSPFSADTVSIDTAAVCIGIDGNSSITAKNITLNNCSSIGLESSNTNNTGPSGITLTDSEIKNTGTAMKLVDALVTNVSNDKFHDNAVGVSLTDMPATTIANNFWGSDSGPTIASNPEGTGDSIVTKNVDDVIYRPWIGMMPAPEHNPIIIVPGIVGSFLTKDYDDKSELWPNVTKLALSPTDSFLDDLELLVGGTPSTVRPLSLSDIIRSVGPTDVFKTLISTLEANGYTEGSNLFVLPYDWRLSNTTNQSLLKKAIANALTKSGKDKVNIIAHSMGGLLVKDYLAQNPDAPIDHLFYIGVPHLGAPKAFQTLMYGDDMGFTFSVAGILKIPLLNANTVKTISQNMPSVYELLPSQKYIDTIGSYVKDMTQSASKLDISGVQQLMVTNGRNEKMFPFAQKLHDAIDDLDQSKYSAYDFIGCGATKTIGSYTLTKEQSFGLTGLKVVPEHRVFYTGGDGVVPLNSANAGNGAANYYVTSGSHGTLPSVPQIQDAIVDVLNGKAFDGISGLSSDVQHCNLSGETVEVHSPMTLDIYDDQGNHTGPTADGEIEYGIPDVDYEMIHDEKFAFLPSGSDYKIVNHAQSIGTYDMYIKNSGDDDSITREAYFSQVPITSANAIGTLTVGPDSNSDQLSIDENGDGTNVQTINAIVFSDPSLMNDDTPPVTDAVVGGNSIMFFAHDNTWVLNTKYSIDGGTTWSTYNEPFQVAPGTTVQYLSMDNAGNTEDIKQLTIPAAAVPTTPTTPPTNIIINEPPVNTPPPTISSDPDTNNTDDTTPSDQTDDTDLPPTTDDQDIPPDDTTQTSTTTNLVPPSDPSSTAVTDTSSDNENQIRDTNNGASSGNIKTSHKSLSSLLHQLLNSVNSVSMPTGDTIALTIIALLWIIILLYIKRHLYNKKKKTHRE